MVELVAGMAHEELETRATIANCMRLHQRLVTLGIRWMPEYDLAYEQVEVDVDCTAHLDDIRALGKHGSPLALEQVLTRARLPVILEQVRPKTVIYTHYVSQIDRQLRDALVDAGWRVGLYTGDDKTGLDATVLDAAYRGAWSLDLDLDGDLDVALGVAQGKPPVLRNNGDGSWAVAEPFDMDGLNRLIWTDFDGDGDGDVVARDAAGRLVRLDNQRNGRYQAAVEPSPLDAQDFAAIDKHTNINPYTNKIINTRIPHNHKITINKTLNMAVNS